MATPGKRGGRSDGIGPLGPGRVSLGAKVLPTASATPAKFDPTLQAESALGVRMFE